MHRGAPDILLPTSGLLAPSINCKQPAYETTSRRRTCDRWRRSGTMAPTAVIGACNATCHLVSGHETQQLSIPITHLLIQGASTCCEGLCRACMS